VSSRSRVAAVVVTWNRCQLLAEALSALQRQTVPVDALVVVDNASDDGTQELLSTRFPDVEVVRVAHNLGGAGGFALGLERVLASTYDWIWLLDDDTVATPAALQALLSAAGDYRAGRPVLLASRVVWTDGRDHPLNTPRPKPGALGAERESARAVGCVPIRSASFVSVLVDTEAVRQRGLPMADYFLWNDDFEFTTRLIRGRRALYCPSSVVVHKTATFGSTESDPGDRFFFEVRNKMWVFSRSHGLNPAEKVLYGGSTLWRWVRTLSRSRNRPTLWRALGRGLAAGVRSGPRPTADVIASARATGPGDG
jgi:rhamnopyranosyl-N-acetylglucosaminyl-diphospho-decaprenol beta-1,3/1,4-galactofuranosyltransferase